MGDSAQHQAEISLRLAWACCLHLKGWSQDDQYPFGLEVAESMVDSSSSYRLKRQGARTSRMLWISAESSFTRAAVKCAAAVSFVGRAVWHTDNSSQ